MSDARRVAITGLGVVAAVGVGRRAFWEGLTTGRSGIRRITAFDPAGLPSPLGGEVPDFDPRAHIQQRKALKVMARDIQLAAACVAEGLQDAGLDPAHLDPGRFGITLGAGIMCSTLEDLGPVARKALTADGRLDLPAWGREGLPELFPLWLLKYLPNMPASHAAIFHNAQGPSNSMVSGEAAGIHAVGECFRAVAAGRADVMVAGSAESRIVPLQMVRYVLNGLASTRYNETPERACRPFDAERDGLVPAEGGGVLVLEDLERARKRGARVYAEVTGFGCSCDTDAGLEVEPSGDRQASAIRAALADARLTPDRIDHVHAQGLGTVKADLSEARALREVFVTGPGGVPISATKCLTGHAAAGAGAVGAVVAALSIAEGTIPGHVNYQHPDPACGLASVVSATVRRPVRRALVNSFSLGGQNAALVVEAVLAGGLGRRVPGV